MAATFVTPSGWKASSGEEKGGIPVKFLLGLVVLACVAAIWSPLRAQNQNATLTVVVTDPADKAVANAGVSIKDSTNGETRQNQTNSTGIYTALNLTPGDYEVTVSADGFAATSVKVTLAPGEVRKIDVALEAGAATAPSLGDLGISPDQAQGSAKDQERLNKRSRMLLVHQRLGLITTAPLIATLITSGGAGDKKNDSASGRQLHASLGAITAGMYFTTAYFAIFAPKVAGTTPRGPIRLHRALAWIHGPGMVITPILGAMAYRQRSDGERVHGIAKAHGAAAWITGISYGAAIASVSIRF